MDRAHCHGIQSAEFPVVGVQLKRGLDPGPGMFGDPALLGNGESVNPFGHGVWVDLLELVRLPRQRMHEFKGRILLQLLIRTQTGLAERIHGDGPWLAVMAPTIERATLAEGGLRRRVEHFGDLGRVQQ